MKDPVKDPENTLYWAAGYCPECGIRHDASVDSSGQGLKPKPGDLTVCMSCGCLCSYGARMNLTKYEQLESLTDEERITVAQARRFVRERMN